jgi:predicted dienelactone hydrolase
MRTFIAVAAVLIALTTPAKSVGFQQVVVPDPGASPLQVGIWYPSDAAASPQQLALFTQNVAVDGPVAGARLPLILISHGTGGSLGGHYDTALALAEAGFVVAALSHAGDTYSDQSKLGQVGDRPRQVERVLDYVLDAWPAHDRIDRERIGIFGHSAGGFTALVLLGAVPDFGRQRHYCVEYPEDWGCRMAKERHIVNAPPASAWIHDPRIKAAVLAAPAIGQSFSREGLVKVGVPIQLWRAEDDRILPHPYHAQAICDALPEPPEYRIVPNAGHFDFLAPCNEALAQIATEICSEIPGFDRTAFHRDFNATVAEFFRKHLPAS